MAKFYILTVIGSIAAAAAQSYVMLGLVVAIVFLLMQNESQ